MKRFDYIRPGDIADAIAALKANDEPYLLAGGTDLLIGLKTRTVKPQCLIDLKGIPDLDAIQYDNGFKLGALTTVRDIEVSPLIREKIPVLARRQQPWAPSRSETGRRSAATCAMGLRRQTWPPFFWQ